MPASGARRGTLAAWACTGLRRPRGPPGDEVFDDGDPQGWAATCGPRAACCGVHPGPIGPTAAGQVVLDVLARAPRRHRTRATGRRSRCPWRSPRQPRARCRAPVPRSIFPPIASAATTASSLLTGTLATSISLVRRRPRAWRRVRRVADGTEQEVLADTVVVCADAVRTPQLLFASGIRPWALGRYLNEHAFVTGRVLMDLDRFGLDLATLPLPRVGEFCTDSLWMPQNGPDQPFHGQIMNTTYVDAAGRPLAHSVGLSLYSPVESRPENRLVFSETETDLAGMPRISSSSPTPEPTWSSSTARSAQLPEIAEQFGPVRPRRRSGAARARILAAPHRHRPDRVRHDDGTSVRDTRRHGSGASTTSTSPATAACRPRRGERHAHRHGHRRPRRPRRRAAIRPARSSCPADASTARRTRQEIRWTSRSISARIPHRPAAPGCGTSCRRPGRIPERDGPHAARAPPGRPQLARRQRRPVRRPRRRDRDRPDRLGGRERRPRDRGVQRPRRGRRPRTRPDASGAWDLGGDGMPAHELVVNWRPCIQCYGATMWSGVRTLVVAGSRAGARGDHHLRRGAARRRLGRAVRGAAASRSCRTCFETRRSMSSATTATVLDAGDVVVYNARRGRRAHELRADRVALNPIQWVNIKADPSDPDERRPLALRRPGLPGRLSGRPAQVSAQPASPR